MFSNILTEMTFFSVISETFRSMTKKKTDHGSLSASLSGCFSGLYCHKTIKQAFVFVFQPIVIENIADFKNSLSLYPRVKPYIDSSKL